MELNSGNKLFSNNRCSLRRAFRLEVETRVLKMFEERAVDLGGAFSTLLVGGRGWRVGGPYVSVIVLFLGYSVNVFRES